MREPDVSHDRKWTVHFCARMLQTVPYSVARNVKALSEVRVSQKLFLSIARNYSITVKKKKKSLFVRNGLQLNRVDSLIVPGNDECESLIFAVRRAVSRRTRLV